METILPDTLNANWKNDKTRFGFKMLAKMGWSEEKGLGKHETGAISAIKLTKREEGLGIGMEGKDLGGDSSWGNSVTGLNGVLELLKAEYKAENRNKNNEKETRKTKKGKREEEERGMKKKRKEGGIIHVGMK